ncbi:MAG TPA: hypothetical protein VH088_06775 [Terriglobales bacterium]|nr:hypothetical protein [Terriglobales bacterium]
MLPIDLSEVLKNAPAGDWLALSQDQERLVGTGKTVEEAIRSALQHGECSPIVMKASPIQLIL